MARFVHGSILTLGVALGVVPATAQVPDSLPADSVRADTTDRSDQFLAARRDGAPRLPVLPNLGEETLQPPHSRILFTRDSIEWTNAETVGDLLARIPGVFLWRGGWVGQAELPNFQGRGATSAEYFLDGLPFIPLGVDSVAVDPSFFAMSILERIEVERLPGLLRVHLFTKRYDRLVPRSRVGIASGDLDIARYQGSLERRGATGFGFAVGADHLAVPTPGSVSGEYRNTAAWLQASYLPSSTTGVLLQIHRLGPDRRAFRAEGSTTDTIAPATFGRRTDLEARYHWRQREDGTGGRVDILYGRSTWNDKTADSLSRGMHQLGVVGAWRQRTYTAGGSAFWRSVWTPLDLRLRAGTAPGSIWSASAEAAYQRHDGGRSSQWLNLRAGAQLPLGFTAAGTLRRGSVLQAPSVVDEEAQRLSDRSVSLGWEHRLAGFVVGYARTSSFVPHAYRAFLPFPVLDTVPATEWVTVQGRLALRQWLTLEGWYSDPLGLIPEGLPPTHSVVTATIRSKFLRNYRSGIFDLKLQVGMETWGTGVIGRTADGDPVELKGATLFRGLIQMQFDSFIMYFDQSNMAGSRVGHVPGYRIIGAVRSFGVRWEFLN